MADLVAFRQEIWERLDRSHYVRQPYLGWVLTISPDLEFIAESAVLGGHRIKLKLDKRLPPETWFWKAKRASRAKWNLS